MTSMNTPYTHRATRDIEDGIVNRDKKNVLSLPYKGDKGHELLKRMVISTYR